MIAIIFVVFHDVFKTLTPRQWLKKIWLEIKESSECNFLIG